MRFSINLATQPYQDAGQFYRRWVLALAVVALVTVGLVYVAVSGWRSSHQINRLISQERQRLAQLESDQKIDEAILNKPENRGVREQSAYLNDAIRRKAFSWTRAFAELEHLMPGGLRVISMKPELRDDNQLAINMVVGGNSRDRALELVRRMEQSQSFRQPAVDAEGIQTEAGDTVQFVISALYSPPSESHGQPPKKLETKPPRVRASISGDAEQAQVRKGVK